MSRSETVAYGVPAFALALFGVPVFVHLPKFYADLGVPLQLLGLAILLTRVFDAVLDPLVGAWSDRVRTRLGRRRPFLMAAPLPLAVAVVLLFSPPRTSGEDLAWWFAGTMAVAFLAWTAVHIPHQALGPELTESYHGRTSLFAVRDGLWIAGTLAAAVAPAVFRAWLGADDDRPVFQGMGWTYAVLLVALPWWCAARVRERFSESAAWTDRPVAVVKQALANEPFRVLLVAYAVGALGGALPGTLILFYVEHVLGAPELADSFLALYFFSGFVCLPGWTWLARRIGKKPVFLWALGLSFGVFSGAFFLGRGDTLAYGAIVVLSGAGFGASLVLPASMQADAIDYDELRSGHRREGAYLGLWSIVMKASAAVGAGVALPILGWAGYVADGPQPPSALLALRILYCAVPCACYAAAWLVATRYPLDEARHAEILRQLGR